LFQESFATIKMDPTNAARMLYTCGLRIPDSGVSLEEFLAELRKTFCEVTPLVRRSPLDLLQFCFLNDSAHLVRLCEQQPGRFAALWNDVQDDPKVFFFKLYSRRYQLTSALHIASYRVWLAKVCTDVGAIMIAQSLRQYHSSYWSI